MALYCSFDTCILFILSLNYHFLLPLQFFKSKKRHTANFYIWHFLFLPYSSYVWRKFFFEYFLSTFMSLINKFISFCLLILNVWTSVSLVVITTIIEIVWISTSIWLKVFFCPQQSVYTICLDKFDVLRPCKNMCSFIGV